MGEQAMTQCPADSELMKSWNTYLDRDEFKDNLYWATTPTRMREERAQELGMDPRDNVANAVDREQRVKGCLWAAFLAGFAAAGGKTTF